MVILEKQHMEYVENICIIQDTCLHAIYKAIFFSFFLAVVQLLSAFTAGSKHALDDEDWELFKSRLETVNTSYVVNTRVLKRK